MTQLSDIEREIATILLDNAVNRRGLLPYKELAEELTKRLGRKISAHFSLGKPLGNVSRLCFNLGLPLLSARVVHSNLTTNETVGPGFGIIIDELRPEYKNKKLGDVWRNEIRLIRECQDWHRLKEYLDGVPVEKILKVTINEEIPSEPTQINSVQDETVPIDTTKEERFISGTERDTIIQSRIGQDKFRSLLYRKYNGQCIMSGIDLPELLIASHIRPWDVSTDEERLSVDNGLLLCATYDRLFDRGLITFDENGKLFISSLVDDDNLKRLHIKANELYDIKPTPKMMEFLEYHHNNVFKK